MMTSSKSSMTVKALLLFIIIGPMMTLTSLVAYIVCISHEEGWGEKGLVQKKILLVLPDMAM